MYRRSRDQAQEQRSYTESGSMYRRKRLSTGPGRMHMSRDFIQE
jgi:hypothetical protein